MKLVIVGASGSVGRQIVPLLIAAGCDLVLIGRDKDRLAQIYPGLVCCAPDDVDLLRGSDRMVNLSVRNNDHPGKIEEFLAVNRDFALAMLDLAQNASIPEYVYVSSVHALEPWRADPYSVSKRLGQAAVAELGAARNISIATIFLGAMAGNVPGGKLGLLYHLPAGLARCVMRLLSTVRPVCTPAAIAKTLLEPELCARAKHESICVTEQSSNETYDLVARAAEAGIAIVALALGLWILAVIAILVRLDSRGPALFAQTRVGHGGQLFTCYKFRTMRCDTRDAPTHEVSPNSVTRLGSILRRFKIDELPQLWNVIRGEMSLVGPRPGLPIQQELFAARNALGVLKVRPGITGLAQVEGIDMSDPVRLAKFDRIYVDLRSLSLDARIVGRTILGGGRGDRVMVG